MSEEDILAVIVITYTPIYTCMYVRTGHIEYAFACILIKFYGISTCLL